MQEIYRIKLPGPPTEIGEGKPENQNHAIIFTRGEALQAIDMNQVGNLIFLLSTSDVITCRICKYYPVYDYSPTGQLF